MKKYYFVLSLFVIIATAACETSIKAVTNQTKTAEQLQTVAAPVAIVTDSTTNDMPMKKGFSKKAVKMERAQMAPMEKAEMLRKADEVTTKKQ
jgi:hypothetical protein